MLPLLPAVPRASACSIRLPSDGFGFWFTDDPKDRKEVGAQNLFKTLGCSFRPKGCPAVKESGKVETCGDTVWYV